MITAFITKEDVKYLFDDISSNLNKKSLGFIKAWTNFIDLRLERHFIVFNENEDEDEDERIDIIYPQFSYLKGKGKVHIKYGRIEDNIDLAAQQRCIVFNSNNFKTNNETSRKEGCLYCNIREEEQFVNCIEILFELNIFRAKSFVKNKFNDFPQIQLPVNTLLFFDPYFPKINSNYSTPDLSQIAPVIVEFCHILMSKIENYRDKNSLHLILLVKKGKNARTGAYYNPIGAIDEKGNIGVLEDDINKLINKKNVTISIVLGDHKLHDRGFFSDFFQIISTDSIYDKSSTLTHSGIMADSNGYFENLKSVNDTCQNKLSNLLDQYTVLSRFNLI